jgi:hypothetical protein
MASDLPLRASAPACSFAANLLATALEFSGGASTSLGSWAALYAKVSYTTGIDANSQSAVSGRLGFRLIW